TMETKRLAKALLSELEQIADVACEDRQAIICLVGEDIHGKPGIAASVFNIIANAGVNIRMISQGASEINISFVVQESDVPKAVRHLHEQFFPANQKNRMNCGIVTANSPKQNRNGSHLVRKAVRTKYKVSKAASAH